MTNFHGSARGLGLARLAEQHPGPILMVGRDGRSAHEIDEEVRFYLAGRPDLPVLSFPDWESLPYEAFSPHPDLISQRLETLSRLPTLAQGVVIVPLAAALARLPPPAYLLAHSLSLTEGQKLEIAAFRERLIFCGYQSVSQVLSPGEYAVRGGIVDLFPMGSATPFRLDLNGDTLDTLRRFDPDSQRSGESLPAIHLLPAREYPFDEAAIQRFRMAFRAAFEGDPAQSLVYRDVSRGQVPSGIEYYLPLFFDQTATLRDYLPAATGFVTEDDLPDAAAAFLDDATARYQARRLDRDRPPLPPERLFVPLVTLCDPALCMVPPAVSDTAPPPLLPVDHRAERPYHALTDWLRTFTGRVLVVAETAGRREVIRAALAADNLRLAPATDWTGFLALRDRIALCVHELGRGLLLPDLAQTDRGIAVITEAQLYGDRPARRRQRNSKAADPETIIRSLAEIRPGDPVVHIDHGVGRYLGLKTLDVGDGPMEFLTLEYQDGDKLYVPVTDLERVSRYTGAHPDTAPLHKLGGEAWDKAKRRARERAHDAAVELLEVQARRASREGHPFAPRNAHYQAFAGAFRYEETPDQARAIEETLIDMESGRAMDRLVCGDVGFGKTEVALRAAFLAVQGEKQVALLCPTTLLAQQHFGSFSDRFADFPVQIALLSRFRTAREQAESLARLAEGKVDIVIGTHRLLQQDVRFHDLGLLVIDEEHRFGVRHKERIKAMRAEVDILTLTATPLPRTLNLALAGMRDISLISTAPESRLAVKTFVCEWNDALVREAIQRELRRGGQVYFLHNDVASMPERQARLKTLVPEAEVRIAHGQMHERDLENVMLDFYHQRFPVLLCSTIIETGLDVPSANTILIEQADRFGLAQLHQLRGRIGRSHHRAYCYLLTPPPGRISADAVKRLEAIAAIEELGAGFTLATHDLEIRGAGEILGEQQSGQMDEVGFALYSELLTRAVSTLREGRDVGGPESITEIKLHAPALFDDKYIPDVHQRLVLYKRVSAARDAATLEDMKAEVMDRFGPLPPSGERLFEITALKRLATPLGILSIEAGPNGLRIEFAEKPSIDPANLIRLLQSEPRNLRMEGPQRLRVLRDLPTAEARIGAIREVVGRLGRQLAI